MRRSDKVHKRSMCTWRQATEDFKPLDSQSKNTNNKGKMGDLNSPCLVTITKPMKIMELQIQLVTRVYRNEQV